jgi:DNA-binding transcriptional ArsR family regulator
MPIVQFMKSPTPSLLPLLRSRAQGDIIAWLALHPDEESSLSDLATRTGTSTSTVMREVNRLAAGGLVDDRRRGNQRVVRMRTDTPLFRPLQQLMVVAFGPVPVMTELLAAVDGVERAYVYGSWAARYHNKPGDVPRDVDVLVVGAVDADTLDDVARDAEKRLGREVNIHQVRPHRWADSQDDAFIGTVKSRPMVALDVGSSS